MNEENLMEYRVENLEKIVDENKKCNDYLYDFIIETDQIETREENILKFYINIRQKQS